MPAQRFPSRSARATYYTLAEVLERHGIPDYDYVWLKRHPAIQFEAAGALRRIPFSSSSNDSNSIKVAKRQLENELRRWNVPCLEQRNKESEATMDKLGSFDQETHIYGDEGTASSMDEGISSVSENQENTRQAPTPEAATADSAADRPTEAPKPETTEQATPTFPTQEQMEWDDSFVRFAASNDMLFIPPPQRPMILIQVMRDLMVPNGHFLGIDPVGGIIRALTPSEAAQHRPAPKNASNIAQALTLCVQAAPQNTSVAREPVAAQPLEQPMAPEPPVAVRPPEIPQQPTHSTAYEEQTKAPVSADYHDADDEAALPPVRPASRPSARARFTTQPQPEYAPEPALAAVTDDELVPELPAAPRASRPEPEDETAAIAPQMGRVLVTMECLRRIGGDDRLDTATIATELDEQDRRSLGTILATGRKQGFITDAGYVADNSRAKWYVLTPLGKQKASRLGETPFLRAGKRPPVNLLREAARASQMNRQSSEVHA